MVHVIPREGVERIAYNYVNAEHLRDVIVIPREGVESVDPRLERLT